MYSSNTIPLQKHARSDHSCICLAPGCGPRSFVANSVCVCIYCIGVQTALAFLHKDQEMEIARTKGRRARSAMDHTRYRSNSTNAFNYHHCWATLLSCMADKEREVIFVNCHSESQRLVALKNKSGSSLFEILAFSASGNFTLRMMKFYKLCPYSVLKQILQKAGHSLSAKRPRLVRARGHAHGVALTVRNLQRLNWESVRWTTGILVVRVISSHITTGCFQCHMAQRLAYAQELFITSWIFTVNCFWRAACWSTAHIQLPLICRG